MSEELKFRLQVAARVLEKAADKASDPELRAALLSLAAQLRSGKVAASTLKSVERSKTIDDIVREVREWIWSDIKKVRVEGRERELPEIKGIDKFEEAIDKIVEDFDRKIKQLEKFLEVLP